MNEYKVEDLKRPMPQIHKLYDLVYGVSRSQTMEAGIMLGVFDYMHNWISADEVSKTINSHKKNTAIILDALTSLELLEKHMGLYRNTLISDTYFVRGASEYLGEHFLSQFRILKLPADRIVEMVTTGPSPAEQENDESGEFWGALSLQYANYMRAGITRFHVQTIKDIPELGSPKKILDLGGGPGLTAIALAAEYPGSSAVVFEQPEVARVAVDMARLYGFSQRVSVKSGDYRIDPLGADYDLIFASFTLNYAKNDLCGMLSRIKNALVPGGLFVSLADGLTDEATKPADYVVSMLPWTLTDQVTSFAKGEIANALVKSGFEFIRSLELDSPHGPVAVDVARRPEDSK